MFSQVQRSLVGAGLFDGIPKVKINAPPVDGLANQAVIEFLANYFSIPKNQCILSHGEMSRVKTFLIPDSCEEM